MVKKKTTKKPVTRKKASKTTKKIATRKPATKNHVLKLDKFM